MSKSNKDSSQEQSSDDETAIDSIRKFFAQKLCIASDSEDIGVKKVIEDLSVDGLIQHWKEKGFKNIVTMVGAGISTAAGIPDFRSPGSGLYDNLQKYKLPYPSAIFELDYFHSNPKPFFALAKELYPGTFNPTASHYFIRLLHEKGLLLRHYTQNIDTLDRIAGIPSEKLVEAHGTFFTNHCCSCRKLFSMEWMKTQIFSDKIPKCDKCSGIVKPDIVFFGENLPNSFYSHPPIDFKKCDLLIIMGTSLEVQPFASLLDYAEKDCVRLLINRTKVGHDSGTFSFWSSGKSALNFDSPKNTRDIAYIGDCDDGIWKLVDGLGWREELENLIKAELKDEKKETSDSTLSNEDSSKETVKDTGKPTTS